MKRKREEEEVVVVEEDKRRKPEEGVSAVQLEQEQLLGQLKSGVDDALLLALQHMSGEVFSRSFLQPIAPLVGKLRLHANALIARKAMVLIDEWKRMQLWEEAKRPARLSSENAEKHITKTQQKNRDYVRRELLVALANNSDAEIAHCKTLSANIESEMWNKTAGDAPAFNKKSRELIANLANALNEELRLNLLSGQITPQALLEMSVKDMASSVIKKEKELLLQEKRHMQEEFPKDKVADGVYRCGKCGGRKTTSYQKQTRSADEPMTSFIQCVNCGNRWRQC